MGLNGPSLQGEYDPQGNEITESGIKLQMGDEPVTLKTRSGTFIVKIVTGENGLILQFANSQINLNEWESIKIGNAFQPGCFGDKEQFISGNHCEIHAGREDGILTVWITDLGSKNGTCYEIEEENGTKAVMLTGGQEGMESAQDGNLQILTFLSGGKFKGYQTNEDSVYMDPDNKTIAVADGMGLYGHGEKASAIVIDSVNSGVRQALNPEIIIEQAVTRLGSNRALADSGYGATFAMAREYRDEHGRILVECCNVGDAAVYVIHPTEGLKYVSRDQSRVREMIDRGILNEISRYTHPENNVVLNAIRPHGLKSKPEIKHVTVTPGTVVLTVSDGISDFVTPEEVTAIVMKHGKNAPEKLKALAESRHNESGGFKFVLNGNEEQSPLDGGDNIAIGFMVVGS